MGKSKWEWKEFGKLRTSDDMEDYLLNREYEHTRYFHYTTLETVKNILKGNQFWISNVNGFNDEEDKKQFTDGNTCFSICFSTGVHENLPLWYLYAGADGKGARISFTPTAIKNAIQKGKYELFEKIQEPSNVPGLGNRVASLIDGENMEVSFYDVIYYKENPNEGKCDLKYNTMTNHEISIGEMNKFLKKRNGFCKDLVWYYEKETRLLIRLTGELKSKIKDGQKYVVVWNFNESLLGCAEILLAPDVNEDELSDFVSLASSIKGFSRKDSSISRSKYAGKVRLSPCEKCGKINQIL